ncbi:MAG: hypothetical protein ACPGUV_09580 [Polyangiales bacterium]
MNNVGQGVLVEDGSETLRESRTNDLVWLLAVDAARATQPWHLPWDQRQHLRAIDDPGTAHLLLELRQSGTTTPQPWAYMVLSGLDDASEPVRLLRLVTADTPAGAAAHALRLLAGWLFDGLGRRTLWTKVDEHDHAGQLQLISAGFEPQGLWQDAGLRQGQSVAAVGMLLRRDAAACAQTPAAEYRRQVALRRLLTGLDLARQGDLARIEHSALALSSALARGEMKLESGRRGRVLHALLSRTIRDTLAFTGAMEAGLLLVAYDHVRALLELRAEAHFLLADSDEQSLRAEQYLTFPALCAWQARKGLELATRQGALSQAALLRHNPVPDALYTSFSPDRVQGWCLLYGCPDEAALCQQDSWHGHPMPTLVQAIDAAGAHALLRHPAHIAPNAPELTEGHNLRLFAWNPQHMQQALRMCQAQLLPLLQLLSGQLGGSLDEYLR